MIESEIGQEACEYLANSIRQKISTQLFQKGIDFDIEFNAEDLAQEIRDMSACNLIEVTLWEPMWIDDD